MQTKTNIGRDTRTNFISNIQHRQNRGYLLFFITKLKSQSVKAFHSVGNTICLNCLKKNTKRFSETLLHAK